MSSDLGTLGDKALCGFKSQHQTLLSNNYFKIDSELFECKLLRRMKEYSQHINY